MSTAISSRHPFSLPMLDAMARPPPHGHGWGQDGYPHHARPHGSYYPHDAVPRERPLLPGPSTLLSSAAQLSSPPQPAPAPTRELPPYSTTTRSPYYSDYATPSPVGQTPPQFPPSEFHQATRAMQPRRPVDVRLSPGQSSISSERSEELEHPAYFHQPINSISLAPWPQRSSTQNRRILPKGRQHSDASDHSLSQGPPEPHHSAWPTRTFYPHPASPPSRTSASPRGEMAPMAITSLLSNDEDEDKSRATTTVAETAPPSVTGQSLHRLSIRQQPVAARSCGFGERDRRVIDPPPILEMTIDDPDASPEELQEKLRASEYVVQCTIFDETGQFEMSALPDDFKQQRRLMGTLVASPFVGVDENGKEGCFFCFPDLSCRSPGAFTLKFTLVKVFGATLPPPTAGASLRVPQLNSIMSSVFNVYNAKDFPGMSTSTPLTRRLKEQGCTISIKKGVTHGKEGRKSGSLSRVREESEQDDDDDDDDQENMRPKKRGRKD